MPIMNLIEKENLQIFMICTSTWHNHYPNFTQKNNYEHRKVRG